MMHKILNFFKPKVITTPDDIQLVGVGHIYALDNENPFNQAAEITVTAVKKSFTGKFWVQYTFTNTAYYYSVNNSMSQEEFLKTYSFKSFNISPSV